MNCEQFRYYIETGWLNNGKAYLVTRRGKIIRDLGLSRLKGIFLGML